ncbi:hypothetical protein H6P81_014609 [Aristolochia fimbriata]|uniref:Major facilitator superfamily (MFS) profile domain-containing protein n=1 Tax=Aristolochia fimbriata TaxID=158543 RepID=A0AAV7E364_ARIFI|nr:hypothetical protein H6P81_014609 [Aristolochia fimbriata]
MTSEGASSSEQPAKEGTHAVFSALDDAKTNLYHFKAVVIAGMGFFTDAYDLFCISAVAKLIGRIYYYNASTKKPGVLPDHVNNAITGVALWGTLPGQLFFGWLGDKLGRKKVYGITLVTMVGCAFLSGFSLGTSKESVVASLCFFRFWLGFGIGGDYPLSAVIMSECANRKTRGGFIAAVFANARDWDIGSRGIFHAGGKNLLGGISCSQVQSGPIALYPTTRRLFPAMLTYYWRSKMPETARFTALVAGDHQKAAQDMGKVLDTDFSVSSCEKPGLDPTNSYGFFSKEFLRKHGLHLVGTCVTWYTHLRGHKCDTSPTGFCGGDVTQFIVLYSLTFFFANFGPNSTTFIVPAELFPARFRSTCHGISAAAGKAGAIFAVFVVQTYALHGDESLIKKVLIGLAVVNLLGFLFTFLVPETRGRSLEEISGESNAVGGKQAATIV